jgi:hypothetical protein
MAVSSSEPWQTPSASTNNTSPLLEQMRRTLQLGPRASDPSQNQGRRLSDAGRPTSHPLALDTNASSAAPSPDGARILPLPDEQSQRYRHAQATAIETWPSPQASSALNARHSCSSPACSLRKVLDTPELFELVLGFLNTPDILNLRRTSRQWESAVQTSPRLRLHLYANAVWRQPGASNKLLPLKHPGLSIEYGEQLDQGQWILVKITPEAARKIVPHPRPRVRSRSIFEGLRGGLGLRSQASDDVWPQSNSTTPISHELRYEDLFITQPPLLGMQAYLTFPRASVPEETPEQEEAEAPSKPRPCAKISCDAGITLGFLAETAQTITDTSDEGPSNIGDALITFKAIMSYTDPGRSQRRRTNTRSVIRLR